MSVTYGTPLGIWTQLYRSWVSFFCMFTTVFQASHTKTHPIPQQRQKKNTGSGYYSINSRLWRIMSTCAREQLRFAKHRSERKQRTLNCKRCQTISSEKAIFSNVKFLKETAVEYEQHWGDRSSRFLLGCNVALHYSVKTLNNAVER